MVEAYVSFWKNIVDFQNRTTRKNYWLAVLMNLLVSLGVGFILGFIAGITGNVEFTDTTTQITGIWGLLLAVYELAIFIAGLAMSVRRMHDVNKSGWYLCMAFIPLVGWIFVLIAELSPSVECNRGQQV